MSPTGAIGRGRHAAFDHLLGNSTRGTLLVKESQTTHKRYPGRSRSADCKAVNGTESGKPVSQRPPPRRKLYILLLSTTATLLSLVLLEGSFRLFFGRATPKAPIYPGEREPAFNDYIDPLVGWKMPPNIEIQTKHLDRPVTYRSNSQGFRDARAFDIADNRCRIVFLGDSFTFGTGVEAEETFAARVEAELGIRSYNLGVTGFGIDQMLLTLRHYGLQLKPVPGKS